MEEKVKAMEKHLEIASQINLKMESLQTKIEELDKWRNMEKIVPSSLPMVKAYNIRLHTLATNECQEPGDKLCTTCTTTNIDAFFFIKNSLSLECSSKEQFTLNNEDLDIFMNLAMFP